MRRLMNICPLFLECKSPPTSEEISQAPVSVGCGTAALSGIINSILTYREKVLGHTGEKVAPKEALKLLSKMCHFQRSFNSSFETVDPS